MNRETKRMLQRQGQVGPDGAPRPVAAAGARQRARRQRASLGTPHRQYFREVRESCARCLAEASRGHQLLDRRATALDHVGTVDLRPQLHLCEGRPLPVQEVGPRGHRRRSDDTTRVRNSRDEASPSRRRPTRTGRSMHAPRRSRPNRRSRATSDVVDVARRGRRGALDRSRSTTLDDDDARRATKTRTRSRSAPEPVRPAWSLVRRAHLRRLREQGEAQPREPDLLDEHGGPHPRSRHPDGRRRRVQGWQEGHRHKKMFPGYLLCAASSTTTRGRSIRQTPGRDGLRRPGHQALAAVRPRSRPSCR